MANGREERKGTSLCRKGPSVGRLGGDEPTPPRQRRKALCKTKCRAQCRQKGRPQRSPLLALLCVARHRPGSALTGGTASSQACALAEPGQWAGLVEGLVLMTVGVDPSGDHFLRSRPGPVSAGRAYQYGRAV